MHIRQTAARITACTLLASTLIFPAFALTSTVVTGGNVLRVRSQASANAEVLTKLSDGTKLELLGDAEGGWYKIACQGVSGYVSSDYVAARYGKVNTESSPLKIRKGPSADQQEVGKLASGEVVQLLGETDGWYQIEDGYVSTEYITLVDGPEAASEPAPASAPAADNGRYGRVNTSSLKIRSSADAKSDSNGKLEYGEVVRVLDETEGWYKIDSGYISAEYVVLMDGADAEESPFGKITTSSLKVRKGPGSDYDEVGKLTSGQVVRILEQSNGWCKIDSGYISAEYVSLTKGPTADKPLYGKVNTDVLKIRSGPGSDYKEVGKVASGTVAKLLGESNGWYKTESGYVSAEYVTLVEAPGSKSSGKAGKESKESDAAVDYNASESQQIVDYAMSFRGYPYVYGGSSPKGFDCSGFTSYVYKHFGYRLNRSSSGQLDNGSAVSRSNLQPGDLVLFKAAGTGSKRASHVGIYIGGNKFVHASTAKVGVIVSSLSERYYNNSFIGGRRII